MAEARARNRGAQFMAGNAELLDSRFGARTYGPLTEITPGMEVWTSEEGRRNWREDLLGGIVLAVDAGAPDTLDATTGEIIEHPARFRCYNPIAPWPHRAFTSIAEGEVNRESIAVAETRSLVLAVRRFCGQVCDHTRRRYPGHFDDFEAQLVTDAARLVAVLMMGTR